MPRLKDRQQAEREKLILLAINHYNKSSKASLRISAETFGIAWTTLRDRLNGAQNRRDSHRQQQVLSDHEEQTIVDWCACMDDWGFPLRLALVHEMAAYLVQKRNLGRKLGKRWLTRFLDRHPELASKFSMRLERQRAYAENPVVIQDYFKKVRLVAMTANRGPSSHPRSSAE